MFYIPKDAPIPSVPDDRGNIKSMQSNESRFLRMFQGIELNRAFYFSYTYDLTRSLQVNMEPVSYQLELFLETKRSCPLIYFCNI